MNYSKLDKKRSVNSREFEIIGTIIKFAIIGCLLASIVGFFFMFLFLIFNMTQLTEDRMKYLETLNKE